MQDPWGDIIIMMLTSKDGGSCLKCITIVVQLYTVVNQLYAVGIAVAALKNIIYNCDCLRVWPKTKTLVYTCSCSHWKVFVMKLQL